MSTDQTKKPIDIKKLLKSVLHFDSSDLHLVPGSEPQRSEERRVGKEC